MYSVLKKKLYTLLGFMLGILLVPFAKAKEPILIYNQFPLVWNMDFNAMAEHLPTIAGMGFNVVWVNPFFKSTNNGFLAVDEGKGTSAEVRSSLYEMYDPSLIWLVDNPLSAGNPSGDEETKDQINAIVKNYTDRAKANGLTPIFDLVLNHVAPDSPLVSGMFSHFRDMLHINTATWFNDQGRWGKGFNYTTPEKRDEIFEHLWKPLITRAIIGFGFDGVRIDYGTAVNQEILQKCINWIKELKSDAIVTIAFGEALIPGHVDIVGQLESCRNTHFTHLTNNAFSLRQKSIEEGRHDGDGSKGYWWFLHDLGLKKATTKPSSKFWSGTIGFSGSHDDGTTLQRGAYLLIDEGEINRSAEQMMSRNEFRELFASPRYNIRGHKKFCEGVAKGRLIDQKLRTDFLTEEAKISLAKERMAIAAFSSDAGWYFMVGDEKLSTVTKRPFVQTDGDPFGGKEDMHDVSLSDTMPRFVKSINETFKNLRESSDKFWIEMFYLHEKKGICFIRHLSGNQLPADVVVVNLRSEAGYSMRDIGNIMDTIRGYASLPKDIDITARNLRFYFVN